VKIDGRCYNPAVAVVTGDGLFLVITQMCWATLWPYPEVYSSLVTHNIVISLFWFSHSRHTEKIN